MTSFFQTAMKNRTREAVVKEHLTTKLNEAVKNVQLNKTLVENDSFVTSEEAAKELVAVLEAIFIHGVKETFTEKISSAFGDPDRMPAPEFWTPMMIFTPRHTISQVNSYAQIATDVGRSRSWIRVCLNEGFFLGYLMTIAQETKSLKPYYKNTAYLVDHDRLNIAISFFQGLSQFKFSFPHNSRFLNCWSTYELVMAGYCTPSFKMDTLPVQSGTDAIMVLPDDDSDSSSVKSFSSAGTSLLNMDPEEALKMILNTPTDGSPLENRMQNERKGNELGSYARSSPSSPMKSEENHVDQKSSSENDEKSPELTEDSGTDNETVPPSTVRAEATSSIEIPGSDLSIQVTTAPETQDFQEVLDGYKPHPKSSPLVKPNFDELLSNFDRNDEPVHSSASNSRTKDLKEQVDPLFESTFEFIEDSLLTTKSSSFKHLVNLLRSGKIVQEPGLMSQEFLCKDCGTLIGFTTITARVCSLSGNYYCADCFKNYESVIPGRIIHNWDFMKYPVSPHSCEFLNEIHMHPLINLRSVNPQIYLYVEEMHIIQKQRLRLNLLRQYLFTCHDSTKNRLQSMLWPREYLYEHVHQFSIMDLMEAASGALQMLLKKAINMSVEHVKTCQLCSQKGFICEICQTTENSPPPIFPFDLDNIFRCSECRSIYHKECMKKKKDEGGCPKCDRIERRKIKMERNLSTEN